jgi:hypothetical protein
LLLLLCSRLPSEYSRADSCCCIDHGLPPSCCLSGRGTGESGPGNTRESAGICGRSWNSVLGCWDTEEAEVIEGGKYDDEDVEPPMVAGLWGWSSGEEEAE